MSPSPKSIKYEDQHCISSTNGSISIDISIFWEVRSRKVPGAVGKWGLTAKKYWISNFFGQRQNLTPRQIEIPK